MQKFDYSKNIGQYVWLNRDKTDSLIGALDTLYLNKTKVSQISNSNLYYLERLIILCKNNNVEVFLIRSPQHKYLEARRNEVVFQKIRDSLFSEVAFLDFNDFPIKDNQYGDFGHLNHKGAKVFSEFFNNLLSDSLLNKARKRKVY